MCRAIAELLERGVLLKRALGGSHAGGVAELVTESPWNVVIKNAARSR